MTSRVIAVLWSSLVVLSGCSTPQAPPPNPDSVRLNVEWHQEPVDLQLLAEVQKRLSPVRDKQWDY